MTATTAPARFRRVNRGTGHSYTLDGEKVPGVTTVLGQMAKPALVRWAAKTAGSFAVDHWAELSSMAPTERLDAITNAPNSTSRKAMTRGTRIHTFGAQLSDGVSAEVPEELASPVAAYARFLDQWQMRTLYTEMPVCSLTHRYGGTLDAIVESPRLGVILLDIKTGGVYREAALQLAAYRYADIGLADEGEVVLNPDAIQGAYVARVHDDDVELIPVDAREATFRTFLYLLAIHRWVKAAEEDSPIGRTLFPEEVPS